MITNDSNKKLIQRIDTEISQLVRIEAFENEDKTIIYLHASITKIASYEAIHLSYNI